MAGRILESSIAVLALVGAMSSTAAAQTCIKIDETYDTLSREERAAAVLLLKKQFAEAGHRTTDADCEAAYALSHIRLGRTIIVSLTGPLGSREGKALGLEDLP